MPLCTRHSISAQSKVPTQNKWKCLNDRKLESNLPFTNHRKSMVLAGTRICVLEIKNKSGIANGLIRSFRKTWAYILHNGDKVRIVCNDVLKLQFLSTMFMNNNRINVIYSEIQHRRDNCYICLQATRTYFLYTRQKTKRYQTTTWIHYGK